MAACVPTPIETVFQRGFTTATLTFTDVTTVLTRVPGSVVVTQAVTVVAGVPTPILVTTTLPPSASAVIVPVTSLVTTRLVTSLPVSTILASCPTSTSTISSTTSTTSTTSTRTTPTSTSTSTSTTPTTSSTPTSSSTLSTSSSVTSAPPSRSTVFSVTTVPASSSAASSASAAANTGGSSSSSTPVGAIAGGVVGGVAVLIIGALLIWWCGKRNKKHDKDWDFREDDAWDPALGVGAAGLGSMKRRGSRGRSFGSLNGRNGGGGSGGGAMAMTGAAVGAGGAYSAYDDRRKSRKPADQQDNYYASLPPRAQTATPMSSEDYYGGGMAGIGLRNQQHQQQAHPEDFEHRQSSDMDPYGGLDDGYGPRDGDGGWGVASRMHQPPQPQQSAYGHNRSPSSESQGRRKPVPGVERYSPPSQAQHLPQQDGIPYRMPSPGNQPHQFLPPPAVTGSPAPSHTSLPALGAVWNNGGSEVGADRRGGALRVMNGEHMSPMSEEEQRFGGRGENAYSGLTEGLDRRY